MRQYLYLPSLRKHSVNPVVADRGILCSIVRKTESSMCEGEENAVFADVMNTYFGQGMPLPEPVEEAWSQAKLEKSEA